MRRAEIRVMTDHGDGDVEVAVEMSSEDPADHLYGMVGDLAAGLQFIMRRGDRRTSEPEEAP